MPMEAPERHQNGSNSTTTCSSSSSSSSNSSLPDDDTQVTQRRPWTLTGSRTKSDGDMSTFLAQQQQRRQKLQQYKQQHQDEQQMDLPALQPLRPVTDVDEETRSQKDERREKLRRRLPALDTVSAVNTPEVDSPSGFMRPTVAPTMENGFFRENGDFFRDPIAGDTARAWWRTAGRGFRRRVVAICPRLGGKPEDEVLRRGGRPFSGVWGESARTEDRVNGEYWKARKEGRHNAA